MLMKRIQDHYGVAGLYNSLTKTYLMMKRYAEALPCCQTALNMYERLKDERGIASAWYHLAFIHEAQGRLEQSVKLMEKVVVVDRKYSLPKLAENQALLRAWKKKNQEARS